MPRRSSSSQQQEHPDGRAAGSADRSGTRCGGPDDLGSPGVRGPARRGHLGRLGDVAEAMTAAAAHVRTGEVTTAVKDSKAKVGPITKGQIIGISEHEIEVVGSDVIQVSLRAGRSSRRRR
jgi:hypothetical protein